ncbi:MAG TPA: WcaI family glycosyltransferase [Stellaceae bacterium]|jgi:colanic acid biosynthesis glycosyl transferase WcaI
MNLLIIGLNFAPELTGIGKYTGEMAAWLAARGHDVSVVTTRPYYPGWTRTPGLRGWTWEREMWRGCRIVRCPLYVPKWPNGARRLVHFLSFALSSAPGALIGARGRRFDVVGAIAPTLAAAPLALALARAHGAKSWLHVQDLEIEAAIELQIVTHRRVLAAAQGVERGLLRRFDLVSTISPNMRRALADKGVVPDRLGLCPNWIDTAQVFPIPEAHALRREFGVDDGRCVVLYAGSMGTKQGLETVIDAARCLAGQGAGAPLFLLAGAGPALAGLEQRAAGLANVKFLPLQPIERFNRLLNVADIHILPQRRGVADLVMPSKLGAMLAVGKPVIATAPATSQLALTLEDAGVIVPPEEPVALAAAIERLCREDALRRAMGRAALRIAGGMTIDATLGRFEQDFLACAGRGA